MMEKDIDKKYAKAAVDRWYKGLAEKIAKELENDGSQEEGTITPKLEGTLKYDASMYYKRVNDTIKFNVKITRDEYEELITKLPTEECKQ